MQRGGFWMGSWMLRFGFFFLIFCLVWLLMLVGLIDDTLLMSLDVGIHI